MTHASVSHAGTLDKHLLEIDAKKGPKRSVPIPCNTGSKCDKGITSVFTFDIEEFFSGNPSCIRLADIKDVALVAGGNDGWFPASVYTTFSFCGSAIPGTADKIFYRWVDGNGAAASLRRVLTLVY